MTIDRHPNKIVFHLHPAEAIWLLNSFQQLRTTYGTAMESLSESERVYFKGTLRDSQNKNLDLKSESESLEIERQEWKNARFDKTVKWLQQFENFRGEKEFAFTVPLEDLDALLQITNDRRLLLAATHGIKEEDMHHDFMKLRDHPKDRALIEIDFLAMVQSSILHCLMDDA